MEKSVFSGQTLFINFSIRIIFRKFHHHVSGRSDYFPGQENVFQPKGLDLLPVFRPLCEVHLE